MIGSLLMDASNNRSAVDILLALRVQGKDENNRKGQDRRRGLIIK